MARYGRNFGAVVRSAKATFRLPLSNRVKAGDRILTCSWSDFFHEKADPLRADAWAIIRQRPDVQFLVLTKRPERFQKCLPPDWGAGWPNVMLLVTAENQEMADLRIPLLLETPAALRGVSIEPALGDIDFVRIAAYVHRRTRSTMQPDFPLGLHWLILGGETGPDARPMHPGWARSIRDQCKAAAVPFYFKQWGEFGPVDKPYQVRIGDDDVLGFALVGAKAAGRLLDGVEHVELPGTGSREPEAKGGA
jgi:protein gp37